MIKNYKNELSNEVTNEIHSLQLQIPNKENMAATGQTLQSSSTILSSSSSQSTQPHLELEQLPRVRPLMDIKKLYQIIWKFKSCGSAA